VAYPISYRQLEEMMEEHGVEVDHATLNRWVLKYIPLLDQEFRARKHASQPSAEGTVLMSWCWDAALSRVLACLSPDRLLLLRSIHSIREFPAGNIPDHLYKP
jgi:hypothetical protein